MKFCIPKQWYAAVVALAGLAVAGGALGACAGPPSPVGTGGGSPSGCTKDSDCTYPRVCQNNACVAPSSTTTGPTTTGPTTTGPTTTGPTTTSTGAGPTCNVPTDGACTSNGDCSDFCANNGYCTNFNGSAVCADVCVQGSDCASGCCVQATAHSVCGPASLCPATGVGTEGTPCANNSDCASQECAGGGCGQSVCGWCTMGCASDSDCTTGWCVQNAANAFSCFEICTTDADCTQYPGTTCKSVTSTDDGTQMACST